MYSRILILYGSETGTCQDLAILIARHLSKSPRLNIELMACDEYSIQNLPTEKFVLFICSTTGIGEEPNNMKRFWRFLLRKDLPSDSLDQMTYAVIGLGDSSYQKYNFVAKKLAKRLKVLGAKECLELVLGDDQHELGPFVKIDPWLQDFYKLHSIPKSSKDELFEPSFKVSFVNDSPDLKVSTEVRSKKYDCLHCFCATVIRNDRVTAEDHFQDVRLMSLQLDDSIHYNLGDVCVAYYRNSDEDVEIFLGLFQDINGDQVVKLQLSDSRSWIPKSSFYNHLLRNNNPCTIRELIQAYLDIKSIPKRSFFDLFRQFSRNDLERDMLDRFASGSDLDELYDYINRPKRTILEVLADFPHTTPYVPFRYWFDLIPAITARPYSIASSPHCDPSTLDILYAVVNYRTRIRKPRLGQCTNWLANQPTGSNVSIYIRSSSFKLNNTDPVPLVMISIGTGVAPFRALIHDRGSRNIGENYLFFGCRYSQADYYLRDEWRTLADQGLLQVFTAFSREDPDHKVYIQHILWQQRQLFRELLERKATVLVAGKSQQYPQLIRETIVNIVKDSVDDCGDQNDESTTTRFAEQLVAKMEQQKRIQFECW